MLKPGSGYRDGFADDSGGHQKAKDKNKGVSREHSLEPCDCGGITLRAQPVTYCTSCHRPVLRWVSRPFPGTDPLKDGRRLVPQSDWRIQESVSQAPAIEIRCVCRRWILVGNAGIDFGIDRFGAINQPVWHDEADCHTHAYLRLMGWDGEFPAQAMLYAVRERMIPRSLRITYSEKEEGVLREELHVD